MKLNQVAITCMFVLAGLLAGCASSHALVQETGGGQTAANRVSSGSAQLVVTATVRTHKPGVYAAKDPHGTDRYQLLVKVDGREVRLKPSLATSGKAVTYRFVEGMRLAPGRHTIAVALTDDVTARERAFTLADGESATLVVEPVYGAPSEKRRPSSYRADYLSGVSGLRIRLNGRYI